MPPNTDGSHMWHFFSAVGEQTSKMMPEMVDYAPWFLVDLLLLALVMAVGIGFFLALAWIAVKVSPEGTFDGGRGRGRYRR